MKSVATDTLYQSTFLPKVFNAEVHIKKLIVYYFLHLKPKQELINQIEKVLSDLWKSMPSNVINKESYVNGLRIKAEKMLNDYYSSAIATFFATSLIVRQTLQNKGERVPVIATPIDLQQTIKKYPYSMWEQAKGTPNYVSNYVREVKRYIKQVADESITATDSNGVGLSIWQRAELDIRHEHQLKMVEDAKATGKRYWWTSSHPDCSKRCEKWQGKLFDILAEHSDLSGHRMKEKVDGNTVYCFEEVRHLHQYGKNGKDYGENSIIDGYNCRHRLIEYTGQLPPKEYSAEDIKKEREINAKIKALENDIRHLKIDYRLAKLNKQDVSEIVKKINQKTKEHRQLCAKYGYANENYRMG